MLKFNALHWQLFMTVVVVVGRWVVVDMYSALNECSIEVLLFVCFIDMHEK